MTSKKHKNNKSHWVEDTPEKLSYICETLYEENMQLKEKLTKYQRAFEILKDKFKIQLSNDVIESVDMNDNPKTYYIYQVMFVYDRAIYAHDLEQEEYELLEELMVNE